MHPVRRLGRAAHSAAGAAGAALVFSAVFVASLVVHGDLPSTRRAAATVTTSLLGRLFLGRLVVGQIDHIGFDGADIAEVEVFDPGGRRVILARGVHARISVPGLLRSLLDTSRPLVVDLREVRIDQSEVLLEQSPSGTQRIADAFALRPGPAPTTPAPPKSPSRPLRVDLSHILLVHAWAHGEPVAGVPIDAEASVVPGRVLVTDEGVAVDVDRCAVASRAPAALRPRGEGEYHLRLSKAVPPAKDPVLRMWASFQGTVADMPAQVTARLEGRDLEGAVDLPRTSPEALRALLPGSPLREAVAAKLSVSGTLPNVRFTGRAVVGQGEINLGGRAHLASPLHLEGDVSARDMDPRAFSEAAPAASLGADAHVNLRLDAPDLDLDVTGSTFPFTLSAQAVPGTSVHAHFNRGVLRGTAEIFEPGAPGKASFTVERSGAVLFEGETRAPRLKEMIRLEGALDGSASASVKGRFEGGALDVNIDGAAQHLGKGPNGVAQGALHAHLHGKPADLLVESRIDAQALSFAGLTVKGAQLSANGPIRAPTLLLHLEDPRWSALSVRAAVRPGMRGLTGIRATLERENLLTRLNADSLELLPGGGLALRKLSVYAGTEQNASVEGSLVLGQGGLDVNLDGTLELSSLARVVPGLGTTGGTATFGVHLKTGPRDRSGFVDFAARNVQMSRHPYLVSADARAVFSGENLSAQVSGSVASSGDRGERREPLAELGARGEGRLVGSLLSGRTWKEVTGTATVERLQVDLAALFRSHLVPGIMATHPSLPRLEGQVVGTASLSRPDAARMPVFAALLGTRQLVAIQNQGSLVSPREARVLEGVDVFTALQVGPPAGESPEGPRRGGPAPRLALLVRTQLKGEGDVTLAELVAGSDAAAAPLLEDLAALGGAPEARQKAEARLFALPLAADITVAERPLEQLPESIRPPQATGLVSAAARIRGTLEHPVGEVLLAGAHLKATQDGLGAWPVSATLHGHFGDTSARASATVAHEGGPETISAELDSTARLGDVMWGRPEADKWTARGHVEVNDWALESVPQLAASGVAGRLRGTVSVDGLHDRPQLAVNMTLSRAKLQDAQLTEARLSGWMSEGAGFITLGMDQSARSQNHPGGKLEVIILPSVHFREAYYPELDPRSAHTFSARFSHFDIEPLSPLAAPLLADLRGYLDGEITLSIHRRGESAGLAPTELWGKLDWSDGVLLIPQIGQTFNNGRFSLTAVKGDGVTVVDLKGLSLDATRGQVLGSVNLVVPNDLFVHAVLGTASEPSARKLDGHASLTIKPEQKIPVTFEGVPLGDAHGQADAFIDLDPDGLHIDIAVPRLVFELPETVNRQSAEALGENAEVGVVDQQYREATRKRAARAMPVTVLVGVGAKLSDVSHEDSGVPRNYDGYVVVRRSGLDVRLQGYARIELGDELKITGQIDTLSGRILALGKPFNVEPGFVLFDGAASNPFVNVNADWDSPNGIRVFAELVGPLKDAKLRLRSQPPLAESDVVGLVLFGRDPNSLANQPGQFNDQGVAAGSGVASTLVNSLLDPVQVFGRRLETRVDTTTARGTSIGVATEIRPRLWAQVDFTTATQQQRLESDFSAVTLDYRFRKEWSLRTSVGDHGSSTVELVWQFRK